MNEKTRELNQARAENSHLAQQLGEERERREQLEEHLAQQLGEERERREQLEAAASELRCAPPVPLKSPSMRLQVAVLIFYIIQACMSK
jgi:hypothetical protein